MLYDIAKPFMHLRLGSRVVSVNPSAPSVTLESGEVVFGDLVIGADGLHSLVHGYVRGGPADPVPTGDSTYRATIAVADMLKDQDLRPLVETPQIHCWMGPGRHIVGYCIVGILKPEISLINPLYIQRARQEYNLVMIYPEEGGEESWTAQGDVHEMCATYRGWEPRCVPSSSQLIRLNHHTINRIAKLQSLVSTVLQSKLMHRPPMQSWVHHRVVLLGDACHPMLVSSHICFSAFALLPLNLCTGSHIGRKALPWRYVLL